MLHTPPRTYEINRTTWIMADLQAQFLNVIESVFSGMPRAVIRNSDYESVNHTDARRARGTPKLRCQLDRRAFVSAPWHHTQRAGS